MSENVETTGTSVQGKQMGIAGFVLALVTLVLSSWICALAVAAMITGGSGWLMYLWSVLAIVSVVLSAMAMGKLKKAGAKRGLAVAGLVIGIVSTVWCLILVAGMSLAASTANTFSDELQNVDWDQVSKDMQDDLNEGH